MSAILIFDIETIPDTAGIRRLYGLDASLSDEEVAECAFQKRRVATGNDFLPHYLQRVIAISCALRDTQNGQDRFLIWSLADPLKEGEIIQRFYDGVEKFTPQLVSWNGGGFDLPVLHYRGLIHGVLAPRYWEMGAGDYRDSRDFKWNNYISRYHTRHLDMMDLLALYQPRANAPLDELAKLIGYPGKLGMDGSAVWQTYCEGKIDSIRDYCETDVLNTYLVYLRFQCMRGLLSKEEYEREIALARSYISNQDKTHWREFLGAWDKL